MWRVGAQIEAVCTVKQNIRPITEITCQMDYVENHAYKFQEEISAVFYDKLQISQHPMVVLWKDEALNLKCQSFIVITEERSHTVVTT